MALEYHAEAAVARFQIVHHPPIDANFTGGGIREAGAHTQCRPVSAAGRSDEHDELAVLDGEAQIFHRAHRAEIFLQTAQLDARHVYLRTMPKLKPRARCLRMINPTIMSGTVMPTASAAWRP